MPSNGVHQSPRQSMGALTQVLTLLFYKIDRNQNKTLKILFGKTVINYSVLIQLLNKNIPLYRFSLIMSAIIFIRQCGIKEAKNLERERIQEHLDMDSCNTI